MKGGEERRRRTGRLETPVGIRRAREDVCFHFISVCFQLAEHSTSFPPSSCVVCPHSSNWRSGVSPLDSMVTSASAFQGR